ncbi:hypothetical protein [Trichococcus shcherbakoviae]|uniref:Beta-carotene 15,15'-monooxygenase n=1 Tax=Trichococcus shcherbakoviae subsp. psychrophilus TaxID=2585775 RepID=A0A5C5EA52_9LACT|nr:hypothetical protein [Trichococcus shcherbakoviae]TNV70039.1 hypothetical protein FHK04_02050 [Trichococcus shcherbakoviae subsp. psychrophilus]
MNTISNYVDSIFANLPKTPEVLDQKNAMLTKMQDNYQELKSAGKSEHEAISGAIAAYGNIDDFIPSSTLAPPPENTQNEVYLTPEQVDEYIDHRHHFAWAMATGVFLCIMGPSSLFLGQYLTGDRNAHGGRTSELLDILTLVPLFLFVAAGVALFILYGMKEQQFELEQKRIKLDSSTYARLKAEHKSFRPRLAVAVAIGVALCILAPVSLLLSVVLIGEDNSLSLVFLLSFIAIGVFLFIFYGIQDETYEKLLSIGDFSKDKAEKNKLVGIVAGVVFPLAAAIYLIAGFVYYAWASAWIIFPITGILFGIFATVYNGYMDLKTKK